MPERSVRLRRIYIIATALLTLLSLGVFALALTVSNLPDGRQLVIAAMVVIGLVGAIRYPMPASTNDSTTLLLLDTCVILAGVLLLDPATVIVAVAAGALIGEFMHPRPGQRIVANVGQITLQAGVGGFVVMAMRSWYPDATFLSIPGVCTVVAAGVAMHLVNALAIAVIIYVDGDEPFLSIVLPMLHYFDMGQRLGQLGQWAFALMAVVLIDVHPLGVVLPLIPLVAIYTMHNRYNQLLRQVQKTLKGAEANLNAAQRIARLGSWEWETAHGTWHWSDELYRIFGYTPREFQASQSRYLATVHADDRARVQEALDRVSRDGGAETLDYRVSQPDGSERVVHVRLEAMLSTQGEHIAVVGTVLDVTERKQFETRLSHQAYHDPLTGLSNRAHFLQRLEEASAQGGVTILYIDLDNFKRVNDRLGHDAGDRLLCIVAERLRHCLRDGDLASRLGGDEFTVLLQPQPSQRDVERVAQRILQSLSDPIVIDGQTLLVTPSIGVAISTPDTCETIDELLRAADTAMYRVKHDGKAGYAIYDRDIDRRSDAPALAIAS